MKRTLRNIISAVATAATLVTAGLLINTPVAAKPIQTPIQDLTHSASLDFFNQGRQQFDREIELLLDRSKLDANPILKVSPEVLPQTQLIPLEKLQVVPDDGQKSEVQAEQQH